MWCEVCCSLRLTVLTGVKKWDSLQEELASEIRSALGSAAPVKRLCLCLHTFPIYELNTVLYDSRWDSTPKLFYPWVGRTALQNCFIRESVGQHSKTFLSGSRWDGTLKLFYPAVGWTALQTIRTAKNQGRTTIHFLPSKKRYFYCTHLLPIFSAVPLVT